MKTGEPGGQEALQLACYILSDVSGALPGYSGLGALGVCKADREFRTRTNQRRKPFQAVLEVQSGYSSCHAALGGEFALIPIALSMG